MSLSLRRRTAFFDPAKHSLPNPSYASADADRFEKLAGGQMPPDASLRNVEQFGDLLGGEQDATIPLSVHRSQLLRVRFDDPEVVAIGRKRERATMRIVASSLSSEVRKPGL
jgi:hypothetical protein